MPRRIRPQRAKQYSGAAYRELRRRVAANLQRLRRARGWTQEEAAHRCGGMTTQQLQRIEGAGGNLTLTTLARLIEGFAIDIRALFAPRTKLVVQRRGRPAKVTPRARRTPP